jgi:hypothetical protein
MLLSLILFASQAFAAEFPLNSSEFLLLMNKGNLALERVAMDDDSGATENIRKQLIEKQKARYSNFVEAMWYPFMLRSKPYRYYVIFDWAEKKCVFSSAEETWSPEIKSGIGLKPIEKYTVIPISTCEKMFHFVNK